MYFKVPEEIFEELTLLTKKEAENANDGSVQDVPAESKSETSGSIIEAELLPVNSSQDNAPHIKSEKSQKQYDKEAANKEKAGKNAEEIAYASLKDEYPHLIWHSKNSAKPADKNNGPVNVVCDMWDPDSKGRAKYFEIKSATNEFEMPIHEYTSMENNKDDYYVVLVDNATGKISLHQFDKLKDLGQVSKYRFCFTLVEKQ